MRCSAVGSRSRRRSAGSRAVVVFATVMARATLAAIRAVFAGAISIAITVTVALGALVGAVVARVAIFGALTLALFAKGSALAGALAFGAEHRTVFARGGVGRRIGGGGGRGIVAPALGDAGFFLGREDFELGGFRGLEVLRSGRGNARGVSSSDGGGAGDFDFSCRGSGRARGCDGRRRTDFDFDRSAGDRGIERVLVFAFSAELLDGGRLVVSRLRSGIRGRSGGAFAFATCEARATAGAKGGDRSGDLRLGSGRCGRHVGGLGGGHGSGGAGHYGF